MATDFIKNILHPNTANVLTYLLLGKDYIDLSDFYSIKPIKEDIEECMEFLPPRTIQQYDTDSNVLKMKIINKDWFEDFLKKYINAYKEDNLNLKVNKNPPISVHSIQKDEDYYPYFANLFKMYEILKEYPEGQIINLSSHDILREKSSSIRFAEIILDLYLNPPSKKEPYIEIINCRKHYYPKNNLSSIIILNIEMKLKKSPIEIYKALLFNYYLTQSLSKSSNEFLKSLTDKRKNLIIQIFKAYADGAKNIEEIADKLNISRDYVKKIQDELKMKHSVETFEQLIMKAVQENVVRFNSTF